MIWSDENTELLKIIYSNTNMRDLIVIFNRSADSIRHKANHLKLRKKHWTHNEETRKHYRDAKLGDKNPAKKLEVKQKIAETLREKYKSGNLVNPATRKDVAEKIRLSKIGNKNPNYGKSTWNSGLTSNDDSRILSGELSKSWKGGVSFEPYCPKFNKLKREEVRNQYNRKCYLCNKEEKDNVTKTGKKFKLSVHHIDLDKGQGCNGKQWKLVPLCIKCHRKSHSKNIGVII